LPHKKALKLEDHIPNAIDQEIEKKRVATPTPIEIPVNQCREPTSARLLRKVDHRFVEELKRRMLEDPSAPGVSPLALLCYKNKKEVSKKEFLIHLVGEYTYKVLGGLHTLVAKKELHNEKPDHPAFATCTGFIYCGLTDEECLRLASRHNVNGHFIHQMTHRDYVSKIVLTHNTQ
jgi:hypothetical protein